MAPYQYTPVEEDQIRLVVLLPADDLDAEVRVCIFMTDLDTATQRNPDTPGENVSSSWLPFNALSYVWGSEEDPVEITVIDAADNDLGSLHVTQNLASALRRLRYQNQKRLLWIDAICINQRDIPERSKLVENMGEIYRRAPQVIVWLGEGDVESLSGLQYIAWLGSQVEYNYGHSLETMRPSSTAIDVSIGVQTQLTLSEQQASDVWRFFYNDWFGRLWVQPEVILAKDIVILHGKHVTNWATVGRGVALLSKRRIMYSERAYERLTTERPDHLSQRDRVHDIFFNHGVGLDDRAPLSILLSGSQYACKDERDKVFAMRSLNSQLKSWVNPDYSKSVTEVYIQLSIRSILETHRLDLLAEAQLSTARVDAPTWVPNWAVPHVTVSNNPVKSSGRSAFQGIVHESRVLQVAGVTLSKVDSTVSAELSDYTEEPHEYLYIIKDLIYNLEHVQGKSKLATHSLEAYCRVLSLGEYRENILPPDTEHVTFEELRSFFLEACQYIQEKDPGDLPPYFIKVWNDLFWNIRDWALFRTAGGNVGLGPRNMRQGDTVCVFLGANWPLVLRKTTDGRYRVVGKCYLDGFMHGEGLLGSLPEDWKIVWYGSSNRQRAKINKRTGVFVILDDDDIIDPELTIEFFRERGVSVEYFELI